MYGVYGKLAWAVLLLSTVAVVCVGCSGDGEGATTYIDEDLYIYHDTTLSDGTWVVNGSVRVVYNSLTLDNAQLVLDMVGGGTPMLTVDRGSRLEAYGSEIVGNGSGMLVEINGDTVLDNTTLRGFLYTTSVAGISHKEGTLLLDHSRVEDGYILIRSNSSIVVRDSVLTGFYDLGLQITYTSGTSGPRAVVRGTRFINDWGYSYYGTGFGVVRGGGQIHQGRFSVTDCYFNGLSTAIFLLEIEDTALGTVRGNTAENCSECLYLDRVDHRVTVSGNTWEPTSSGYAVTLLADDLGWPDINNETIIGGMLGLYIQGVYGPSTLHDLHITGSSYGIYITSGNTYLHDSYVRSTTYDFYSSGGNLYLFGCDHTYNAYVTSYYAEVSEPVVINFTSVTWQEGTPIVTGYTTFENETGALLSERDNKDPREVMLATWKRTYFANVTAEKARGVYETGSTEFRSEPFAIAGVSRMDLVIVDNSTPEVKVRFPAAGDMFESKTLTLKGNYSERGVGMGAIRVSHDGDNWTRADIFDDRTWQLRLEDLPDGLLTFTVAINDKAGNSMLVEVPNVTIDTVWPFIEVSRPGKYVATTPIHLIARTEPRARAFVDYQEVDVMPDGRFSALITLDGYENEVHVRVVDVVGHENWTIIKVYLDTVPPALLVESPGEGEWVSTPNVTVKGTTESQATVVVNGLACQMDYGMFSIVVPLEYGLNQLIITSTDMSGNAETMYRTVRMDDVTPQLKVTAPRQGSAVASARIVVSGTASDDNPLRVRVNNLSADLSGEEWVREVSLVEGSNTFEVMAIDAAGNSVTSTVTVSCDLTAPTFDVELVLKGVSHSPEESPILTRESTLLLMIDQSEASVLCISGGDEVNLGTEPFAKEIFLDPGPNEFWLYIRDTVGNRAEPVHFVVEVDDEPPGLTLLVDDDLLYVEDGTFLLRGETDPGCQVTIGGVPVTVLHNGSFAMHIPLDEGVNVIRVVSVDEAGNQASRNLQVVHEVDEEQEAMSPWVAIVVAAVCGLLAGLFAALLVGRRGRPGQGPGTGSVDAGPTVAPARGPQAPPLEEAPVAPTGAQEVPGQLPADPQRGGDEWEML